MGKLIHPLSELIRAPELLIPGKKPKCDVVVDILHPLAPDKCFLFMEGGGSKTRDLVNDEWVAIGTNHKLQGGQLINTVDDDSSLAAVDFKEMVELSILTGVTPHETYNNGHRMHVAGGSGAGWYFEPQYWGHSTIKRWVCRWRIAYGTNIDNYNNGEQYTADNYTDKFISAGWSIRFTEGAKIFVDGSEYNSMSLTTGSSTDVHAINLCKGYASWRYLYVYYRKLPDFAMISLQHDPYQFLVPA